MRRHLMAGQIRRPQVLALSKAALVVVRILPAVENSGDIRHAGALFLKRTAHHRLRNPPSLGIVY
jgi:hypothetical protein